MSYKTKLLVTINDSEPLELMKAKEDRILLEFKPMPESKLANLVLTDAKGNKVEFRCEYVD